MSFIRTFSILPPRQQPFPYNIPAVRMARDIRLDPQVTILVGDNGCGKSTILETIGYHLNLPLIGGHIKGASFEAARILAPYLEIQWKHPMKKGFFFRAEDFSEFANAVENERWKSERFFYDMRGEVDDAVINQMKESMNYSLYNARKQYGENMQAFSHGEAYLKILMTQVKGKGIYLLDEPEAALSPLKQLSLISFMLGVLQQGQAQFIIATHSPILMGIPAACLYEIRDDSFTQVAYEDTEHYQITKLFLDNPQQYLRHFQ